MKNPFKHAQTPKQHPSQQHLPTTPPALPDLTDADLKHVQGGSMNSMVGQVIKNLGAGQTNAARGG